MDVIHYFTPEYVVPAAFLIVFVAVALVFFFNWREQSTLVNGTKDKYEIDTTDVDKHFAKIIPQLAQQVVDIENMRSGANIDVRKFTPTEPRFSDNQAQRVEILFLHQDSHQPNTDPSDKPTRPKPPDFAVVIDVKEGQGWIEYVM